MKKKIATKFKVRAKKGVTLYNIVMGKSERLGIGDERNVSDYSIGDLLTLSSNGLVKKDKEGKEIVLYKASIELLDGELDFEGGVPASKEMFDKKEGKKK